jgi:hypothetical protein
MNRQSTLVFKFVRSGFVATLMIAVAISCGSDDNGTGGVIDDDPIEYSPTVDDDVATSLAASLAGENGGIADQIVDIVSLAGSYGMRHNNLVANQTSPTYNLGTRTWEWDFAREFTSANGLYHAIVGRSYQWRFLKQDGQPQITYILGNDTAYTIELTIVSGEGRHLLPELSQTLTSLSGRLVATGTNTDEITVNGTWSRAALDTIRTRYAVRTLNHACSLMIDNMQCVRDTTSQPWRSISGTISGVYSAGISFSSGDAYVEDSVSRDIHIEIDSATAAITVGDSTWTSTLRRGEILLPPEPE